MEAEAKEIVLEQRADALEAPFPEFARASEPALPALAPPLAPEEPGLRGRPFAKGTVDTRETSTAGDPSTGLGPHTIRGKLG